MIHFACSCGCQIQIPENATVHPRDCPVCSGTLMPDPSSLPIAPPLLSLPIVPTGLPTINEHGEIIRPMPDPPLSRRLSDAVSIGDYCFASMAAAAVCSVVLAVIGFRTPHTVGALGTVLLILNGLAICLTPVAVRATLAGDVGPGVVVIVNVMGVMLGLMFLLA